MGVEEISELSYILNKRTAIWPLFFMVKIPAHVLCLLVLGRGSLFELMRQVRFRK